MCVMFVNSCNNNLIIHSFFDDQKFYVFWNIKYSDGNCILRSYHNLLSIIHKRKSDEIYKSLLCCQ